MKNKKTINKKQKQTTDVKGTIIGFITPDQTEKTQEQEIQDFEIKKETDKELATLSEEEQKKKREKYKKEEARLLKIKEELLRSIRERIPAIEKRFRIVVKQEKGKVVPKVKSQKTSEISKKKNMNLSQNRTLGEGEKERE